jgi:succinate dehydrogenase / fumarate reductase, iron-sulfur subunit
VRLILHVWRQRGREAAGEFVRYEMNDLSPDISFLEMLDALNESLLAKREEPVAFDHDCREGICGSCGMVINGRPHGPQRLTTACQLHLRSFRDGQEVWIEPWRAQAFPVLKDLVVDRGAFDRVIQAGGFITARTGSAPEANAVLVPKRDADLAMDAAQCIGCGACVAACPNASAMLFVAAKVSHLGLLPQGQPERYDRVVRMVDVMDAEGFGACTNHGECMAACPKGISVDFIARLNRDLIKATLAPPPEGAGWSGAA